MCVLNYMTAMTAVGTKLTVVVSAWTDTSQAGPKVITHIHVYSKI